MDNLYTLRFDKWQLAMVTSMFCLLLITMGIVGYLLSRDSGDNEHVYAKALTTWEERLNLHAAEVTRVKQEAIAQLGMLTQRVGELQAQLYNAQAISERLLQSSKLNHQEMAIYDTAQYQQIYGGNVNSQWQTLSPVDFIAVLDQLSTQISTHADQLAVLEKLLTQRELTETMLGIGRIVEKGWISSRYGYRIDPFSKKQKWHAGVDISSEPGTSIKAVAAGIVSFAGKRPGYGNMVELDHGNGYTTLYAHNRNNLVVMGDIVNKDQLIAQMGSSGRSTGPHVHFEVAHNGINLDPLPYIQAGYNPSP